MEILLLSLLLIWGMKSCFCFFFRNGAKIFDFSFITVKIKKKLNKIKKQIKLVGKHQNQLKLLYLEGE